MQYFLLSIKQAIGKLDCVFLLRVIKTATNDEYALILCKSALWSFKTSTVVENKAGPGLNIEIWGLWENVIICIRITLEWELIYTAVKEWGFLTHLLFPTILTSLTSKVLKSLYITAVTLFTLSIKTRLFAHKDASNLSQHGDTVGPP